jgi:hypothetical protein
MPNLKWLALGLLVAGPFAMPAQAAMPVLGAPAVVSPNLVEVAVNCGPRAHYIRGHRAKGGEWIKGRCIRDKR